MGNEAGEWIIYGVEWDDPECIHTVDEAIGNIIELIESDGFWYEKIAGIGYETSRKIVQVFFREGFIGKEIEAYKLAKDRQYYRTKLLF